MADSGGQEAKGYRYHGQPEADSAAQPAEAVRSRALRARAPPRRPDLRHISEGDLAHEPGWAHRAKPGKCGVCGATAYLHVYLGLDVFLQKVKYMLFFCFFSRQKSLSEYAKGGKGGSCFRCSSLPLFSFAFHGRVYNP